MRRHAWWLIILVILACISTLACADEPASQEHHLVRTEDGNFTLWHRIPAEEADFGLPFWQEGVVQTSFAYRVRDRKQRDLLFLARMRLTSGKSVEVARAYYATALGAPVTQEVNAKTGEITLVSGEKENFRLVTILPHAQGCEVTVQRVQEYTVPPRVFDAREQRVLRVLTEVTKHYQMAQHVAYTMEQRTTLPASAGQQQPPVLTWTIDFTRPAQLTLTAAVGDTTGLRITTEQDGLHVARQMEQGEVRPLKGTLTIDDVPELQDDPVARMVLGDPLVSDRLDFLAMQAVPGVPDNKQADITLTYPETNTTWHLIVDLQLAIVLRCEATITDGQDNYRVVRSYPRMSLSPVAAPPPAPTP